MAGTAPSSGSSSHDLTCLRLLRHFRVIALFKARGNTRAIRGKSLQVSLIKKKLLRVSTVVAVCRTRMAARSTVLSNVRDIGE